MAEVNKFTTPSNRNNSNDNNGNSLSQFGLGGRNTKPNSVEKLILSNPNDKQVEDEKIDDSSRLIQKQENNANEEGDKSVKSKENQISPTHSKAFSPKNAKNQSSASNRRKSIFDEEDSEIADQQDEFGNAKKGGKCTCSKKCLGKLVDNKYFVIWMTLLTIYALFFDDIRIIGFSDKSVDDGFFVMSSICLFFFVFEIIIASIGVQQYICGFFFWLDILATISIIPDIGWIWDPIIGQFTGANSAASVAKTSRASRAARVIRFVRLIRLIRLVKLYKQAKIAQQKMQERRDNKNKEKNQNQQENKLIGSQILPIKENQFLRGTTLQMGVRGAGHIRRLSQQSKNYPSGRLSIQGESESHQNTPVNEVNYDLGSGSISHINNNNNNNNNNNSNNKIQSRNMANSLFQPGTSLSKSTNKIRKTAQEQIEIPTQSRISKKLSELTTKRVILLCMMLLFLLPLFNGDTFLQAENSYSVAMQLLQDLRPTVDYSRARDIFIQKHKDSNFRLLELYVDGVLQFDNDQLDSLRQSDYAQVQIQQTPLYKVAYSTRYYNIRESIINIFRTIFVAAVLAIASIQFGRLAQNLVLNPIQRMIEKVKVIARNPMSAADDDQIAKAGLLTVALNQRKKEKSNICCKQKSKDQDQEKEQYETVILEKTIIKIGHLLAVGFGQAGSQIIAQNIAAGDLSLEGSGQKMHAIFGFCDIRNFTDATQVLQTEVMMFVNQVAEVVHSVVDKFQGSANKNIGDAFLLVWKFDQNNNELRIEDNELVINKNNRSAQQRADLSILAFLKIIAKVAKLSQLVQYSRDPRILARMPGYTVKMGFGLHSGWAIEGAIGSEYKIDASYLSPNVNMASRLQAATKQYGVPLLISGALVSLCTPQMKKIVREIDTVTVKGSQHPMQLFTVDCDVSEFIETKDRLSYLSAKQKKARRVMQKKDLMRRLDKIRTIDLFKRDSEIVTLRKPFNFDFQQVFRQGYQFYINGNWKLAKERLEEVLTVLKPNDGPSNTLLGVMQEHGFKAPDNWKGFRELTDK